MKIISRQQMQSRIKLAAPDFLTPILHLNYHAAGQRCFHICSSKRAKRIREQGWWAKKTIFSWPGHALVLSCNFWSKTLLVTTFLSLSSIPFPSLLLMLQLARPCRITWRSSEGILSMQLKIYGPITGLQPFHTV